MRTDKAPLLLILSGCVAIFPLSGRPLELRDNTWSNPEFVNWFTGTYAFNGQVNPQINREEQGLFQNIAPLMQYSPLEAISAIRRYLDEAAANADAEAEPYSAALDYTMGSLYLQTGDTASAIEHYERALKRFPTFQRACLNLGLAHVQAGDFRSAIPLLTKAIELGAVGGTAWGLLGFSHLNTGRPTQALTAYEQALVFQPQSRDWRLGKLTALLECGQRTMAIALLNELLNEGEADPALWLQQANAFLGEGATLEAAANLEWVARSGEATGPSLLLLGDIYLKEGLAHLAVGAYEAALGQGDVGEDRLLHSAEALFVRGAHEEAGRFLGSIRTMVPSGLNPELELKALTLEAQLAIANGRAEEAASILEEVLMREPMNGSALLTLGDYYREQGALERAAMHYERASKVDSVQSQALLALGRLYVSRRDYREALKYLREANRNEPMAYVSEYINQLEQAIRFR